VQGARGPLRAGGEPGSRRWLGQKMEVRPTLVKGRPADSRSRSRPLPGHGHVSVREWRRYGGRRSHPRLRKSAFFRCRRAWHRASMRDSRLRLGSRPMDARTQVAGARCPVPGVRWDPNEPTFSTPGGSLAFLILIGLGTEVRSAGERFLVSLRLSLELIKSFPHKIDSARLADEERRSSSILRSTTSPSTRCLAWPPHLAPLFPLFPFSSLLTLDVSLNQV
jgi:hypothetical protein